MREVLHKIANSSAANAELFQRLVQTLRPSHVRERHNAEANLSALLSLLESDATLREGLKSYLHRLFLHRQFGELYTEFGIIEHKGFWSEAWQRLIYKILPPIADDNCAGELIGFAFNQRNDIEWVGQIDIALWQRFFQLCWPPVANHHDESRDRLDAALSELSNRVVHIAYEKTIVRLMNNDRSLQTSLAHFQSMLLKELQRGEQATFDVATLHLHEAINAANTLKTNSRAYGVSIESTVLLKRLQQSLQRLQQLLQLRSGTDTQAIVFTDLFIAAVRHTNRKYSLREHIAETQELHAQEIVEHASRTGEHYVTESRHEYWAMFRAAALAGFIVGFMALNKILLGSLHLPIMLEAIAFSLNYGIGFIAVHLVHGTIATKQPAMTAALVAHKLQQYQQPSPMPQKQSRWLLVADLVAQVTRTQAIAIAGNVLLAMPVALIIVMAWQPLFGVELISSDKAQHLLHDVHPWQSLALFHAAIAGCYLFLAGVISGSFDNRAIFARIPERIAQHAFLQKVLGPLRTQRLSNYIEHNLGALAGNFFFGCFLGLTGAIGTIFGLPIDIRHITFSSANLAFSSYTLHFDLTAVQWVASCLGVLLVGLINLAVSFALALTLGLRARGVRNIPWHSVVAAIATKFRKEPRAFLLPPKASNSSE